MMRLLANVGESALRTACPESNRFISEHARTPSFRSAAQLMEALHDVIEVAELRNAGSMPVAEIDMMG